MGDILAKMDFKLKDLEGFILSPGNIFWKQNSGKLVQVASKSNFLNINLLEKLFRANHQLLVEDQIDLQIQTDFCEFFKNHSAELLVREKAQWRQRLRSLFSNRLSTKVVTQFDLNQLTWKAFSKVDQASAKGLLEVDIDLFNRGMSIATSYTLIAFMLGHYDDKFLKQIFTDTFLNLVDLNMIAPVYSLKAELEKINVMDTWHTEELNLLQSVYRLDQKPDFLLGERFDGSGIQKINKSEMTELEIVLIALDKHYGHSGVQATNIFYDIKNSLFKVDERILYSLQKFLEAEERTASLEQSA